jgi:OmpA-OmpF porin, OOP family
MTSLTDYFSLPKRIPSTLSLVVAGACFATSASSQQVDSEFSVQRFNPAAGPRNLLTTRTLRMKGEMAFSAGAMVNYAYKPFVVERCDPVAGATTCEGSSDVEHVPVVENLVTGDLMGTLTPMPFLQLALRVPVTWVDGFGLNEDGTSPASGVSRAGLGDLELEGKARFYGDFDSPLAAGAAVFLTAPTGSATAEGKYIGDSTVGGGLRAILDGREGAVFWGVNLGAAFRGKGSVGRTDIGSEFRYGAGVGYQASPLVALLVDAFGSTNFSSDTGAHGLEADLAARINPLDSSLFVTLGAGAGLIEGVGVPKVRVFAGVTFVAESSDKDKDGLEDSVDQCPVDAEDLDGFQDTDGCPDLDNDLDSIIDVNDKCPNQEEDVDGFEDADGCPEPDNDKDGIPDVNDLCPLEPETKNNYKDEDGCPDVPDADEDGVPDDRDQCPNEAEDTDGFQDEDGCPDPDNDGDGVPDGSDECIDEPETVNEFEDEDGCPDEKPRGWRPPR